MQITSPASPVTGPEKETRKRLLWCSCHGDSQYANIISVNWSGAMPSQYLEFPTLKIKILVIWIKPRNRVKSDVEPSGQIDYFL